jgi:hypothetical protein
LQHLASLFFGQGCHRPRHVLLDRAHRQIHLFRYLRVAKSIQAVHEEYFSGSAAYGIERLPYLY